MKKMKSARKVVIYTSDDCPYCYIAENIVKEVLGEYKSLFEYKVINLSKSSKKVVNSVPTIIVGNNKIEGIPEKDQIHTALFS